MIFASCSRCGYAMDIFQEPSQLIHAPLACPRCGELELKLQTADDFEAQAVGSRGTQAVDNRATRVVDNRATRVVDNRATQAA